MLLPRRRSGSRNCTISSPTLQEVLDRSMKRCRRREGGFNSQYRSRLTMPNNMPSPGCPMAARNTPVANYVTHTVLYIVTMSESPTKCVYIACSWVSISPTFTPPQNICILLHTPVTKSPFLHTSSIQHSLLFCEFSFSIFLVTL